MRKYCTLLTLRISAASAVFPAPAEVLYYGQKRKINTRGEFVE
jgi:hypothetical protein